MRFLRTLEDSGKIKEFITDLEDFSELSDEKELKILVPAAKIGLIIGRNGKNIRKLKQRVFEIKVIDEIKPNSQEKVMVVTRENPDQGDVVALLNDISKIIGKPIGYPLYDPENLTPSNEHLASLNTPHSMILSLEKRLVGAVIGKEGCTIKTLREEFKVKIHVKPARRDRRDVVIYGTPGDMEKVKVRIEEICKEEELRLNELEEEETAVEERLDQAKGQEELVEKSQESEASDIMSEDDNNGDASKLSKQMKKISFEE